MSGPAALELDALKAGNFASPPFDGVAFFPNPIVTMAHRLSPKGELHHRLRLWRVLRQKGGKLLTCKGGSGGWEEVDRIDYGNCNNVFLGTEIKPYHALNNLLGEERCVHIG